MPRFLGPGEAVPLEPPTIRGKSSHGYVRLQWGRGPDALIAYEHRIRDGRIVPAGYEVHHRNHQKDDNRPDNLELITPTAHGRLHRQITFDVAEAAQLHAEGWSLPRLQERYGVDDTNIMLGLRRHGYVVRDHKTANALRRQQRINSPLSVAAEALYASGLTAKQIAQRFGISRPTVGRWLKDRGVKVRKDGWRYRLRSGPLPKHLAVIKMRAEARRREDGAA